MAEQIILAQANRNSIDYLFRKLRERDRLDKDIQQTREAILASLWLLPDGSGVIGGRINENA